jgi:hypothetical protein
MRGFRAQEVRTSVGIIVAGCAGCRPYGEIERQIRDKLPDLTAEEADLAWRRAASEMGKENDQ